MLIYYCVFCLVLVKSNAKSQSSHRITVRYKSYLPPPKKKVEAKSAQNIFKHVYRKKMENMKAAITNIANEEKRLEP